MQPLALASRSLTDPESLYATIENDLLAVVFALEKWYQFVFGRHVVVRTDQKPLEMITKKQLDRAPRRLQGMLLRSLAYDIRNKVCPCSHTTPGIHDEQIISACNGPSHLQ